MENSFAFIDGKIFSPRTLTFEKQNILLKNTIWAGVGYIPDDEGKCVPYNISNCIILPHIVDPFDWHSYRDQLDRRLWDYPSAAPSLVDLLKLWNNELGLSFELLFTKLLTIYAHTFGSNQPKWGLLTHPSFSVFEINTKDVSVAPLRVATVVKGQIIYNAIASH